MFHNHNVETDTKLFQIRFDNIYWGEVWASDSKDALEKANALHPDFPKNNFKVTFVANLYPVNVLSSSDIRKILDDHKVAYQDPAGEQHQIILQGTFDILEGGFGAEDESWEFFIRSTKTTSAKTLQFKTVEQLTSILGAYYVHSGEQSLSA